MADELQLGGYPVVTKSETLITGQNLAKGTLVGKITLGAISRAAKSGGNTGNGTLTLDGTTPILAKAKAGVYTVRCIAASTDAGTLRVTDPDGFVLGDVAVGGTFANQIKFATADGATDFIVGDGFDVTIAAGSGKVAVCVSTAVNGTQYPYGVLSAAVDATSEDKACSVYVTGEFDYNHMTFGGADTYATHQAACAAKGMFLQDGVGGPVLFQEIYLQPVWGGLDSGAVAPARPYFLF